MADELWHPIGAPPGGEIRGLGVHDGAVVARTSDGLFTQDGWRPIDAELTRLPNGRLVPGRGDLTAFAIAPDGARWVGVRKQELTFYATPGPHGMDMLQPAYPVEEHVEVDGQLVRAQLGARDFAFDAHGRVWVAASNSLEVFEGGTWRKVLGRAASQVAIAPDGTIVVGTPTTGFRSTDGVTFVNLPARAGERGGWGSLDLGAEDVQQIERAPDGKLYGRISDGILVWTGDRWASHNLGLTMIPRKGSRDVRVTALAVTRTHLYAGTSGLGVFRRARR